ncbi:MAG: MFS transporter [Nitrososphaerota archaeon]|nr:MFS transporter [Nitrososphaerota archaeon]MDG7023526.1 MFS transporter [Nitrososphaerota archaeon]
MAEYKWVALSNTTIGTLMASIDATIVLISLPAIFRGISIDPLNSFQYLLWILFGYSLVTSTLLVSFGRISDMYGRVRLFNLGFAIFTAGSLLCAATPSTGDAGALELIVFRLIQGVGGAFLLSNSAAILTDAFPPRERGKALGVNMTSAIAGSLLGLVLGGILAIFNWRFIFLVSVPVGLVGTVWSYWKLEEIATIRKGQKIDAWGNLLFAAGLTLMILGVTYALVPYGSSSMGWGDPWVIASLAAGSALLVAFPFVEARVPDPMFRLGLFRNRMFTAANLAGLFSAVGRGGVQIMLIILLQGIWLPLHGVSYQNTPFWAGVYMIPMIVGFAVMGPVSGYLSDKYGARTFATVAMLITAGTFLSLSLLPYDFAYLSFAAVILVMGMAGGLFAAPNIASIMNSVPPEHRGAASGMRATLQNAGQTISLAAFFTIIITGLTSGLPGALSGAMTSAGVPQLAGAFSSIPASSALFSAFLGYNPMQSILADPRLASVVSQIPATTRAYLTGQTFFPKAIAPAFVSALDLSFYIGAALSIAAALASLLRGRVYIHEEAYAAETSSGTDASRASAP